MSINYTEKGYHLHELIRAAGHSLAQVQGVWTSDNDVAVQAIIDGYDPLPQYKADAISGIKAAALSKMQTLFPAIVDVNMVMLIAELWKSIAAVARSPTTNWSSLVSVYTTAVTGISNVNAATTTAGVDSAVAAITWPF